MSSVISAVHSAIPFIVMSLDICVGCPIVWDRRRIALENRNGLPKRFRSGLPYDEEGYLCGATGCGLCALYQLQRAGITHLKLVGRGNYTDFMERDIRNLRKALKILKQYDSEEMYQKIMKQTLFSKGCSGNCYYRESVAHR